MTIDTYASITHSFKRFFQGTLFSRISGMLRDMMLAFFFGTSYEIAAFLVAYRLANLFRRVFGEALVGATFVPHFEHLRKESEQKASFFYRDLFCSLTLFLTLFVICINGVLYLFLENSSEILLYTMIMLIGLIFICLYALNNSYLQCQKQYFLPAVAPVFFNMIWILALLLFKQSATMLSVMVVIAFFMQWILTHRSCHQLLNLTKKEWLRARFFSKEIKKLKKPIALALLGVAAVQINTALDAIFARFSDLAGPSYLWYAIRLQQLPTALFAIAITSSVFPPLARAQNSKVFIQFLNDSLSRGVVWMLFCTFGIFAVGGSSMNLLFGRGLFTDLSVKNSLVCLWFYGLALLPSVFIFILTAAFHAQKKYRLPALASVFSILLNILLNSVFVFGFNQGAYSVALATSISALFQAVFLSYFLKKEYKNLFERRLKILFVKGVICSVFACLLTWSIGDIIEDPSAFFRNDGVFTREIFGQIRIFTILFLTYTALFFGSFKILALIFIPKQLQNLKL